MMYRVEPVTPAQEGMLESLGVEAKVGFLPQNIISIYEKYGAVSSLQNWKSPEALDEIVYDMLEAARNNDSEIKVFYQNRIASLPKVITVDGKVIATSVKSVDSDENLKVLYATVEASAAQYLYTRWQATIKKFDVEFFRNAVETNVSSYGDIYHITSLIE